MSLTAEITHEIAQAIRKLGGHPEAVKLTDTFQVNRVLEFLGADIYLLCTVGSWQDTASDEETLRDLRIWNADAHSSRKPPSSTNDPDPVAKLDQDGQEETSARRS